MSKHTPGPWVVEVPGECQDGYPHNWSISYLSSTRAVHIASIPGAVHYKQAQANARLIATAPKLLEGLQAVLQILRDGNQVDPLYDGNWIEALIEKATGRAL